MFTPWERTDETENFGMWLSSMAIDMMVEAGWMSVNGGIMKGELTAGGISSEATKRKDAVITKIFRLVPKDIEKRLKANRKNVPKFVEIVQSVNETFEEGSQERIAMNEHITALIDAHESIHGDVGRALKQLIVHQQNTSNSLAGASHALTAAQEAFEECTEQQH